MKTIFVLLALLVLLLGLLLAGSSFYEMHTIVQHALDDPCYPGCTLLSGKCDPNLTFSLYLAFAGFMLGCLLAALSMVPVLTFKKA